VMQREEPRRYVAPKRLCDLHNRWRDIRGPDRLCEQQQSRIAKEKGTGNEVRRQPGRQEVLGTLTQILLLSSE
jgi:hypothetical protein